MNWESKLSNLQIFLISPDEETDADALRTLSNSCSDVSSFLERVSAVVESGYQKNLSRCSVAQNANLTTSWELRQFPIKEMHRRKWFPKFSGSWDDLLGSSQHILDDFFHGLASGSLPSMQRQRTRSGSVGDPYALLAWQCRVVQLARSSSTLPVFSKSSLTQEWISGLVKLSRFHDGPVRAQKYLEETGIAFVVEPHLSGTYLDGAAIWESDNPIVALTLRYDRVDHFWFVLFHEIAHILLHLSPRSDISFIDQVNDDDSKKDLLAREDLDIDSLELQADSQALEWLIPSSVWETCIARYTRTQSAVETLAEKLEVAPAIVAGRIRNESSKWHLFTETILKSNVRNCFPEIEFNS